MTTTTQTIDNVIVSNGRVVHALRKESQAKDVLNYQDVRCGAGNSNRGGIYRQTYNIRRTEQAVTCKRCIVITESDAIWAGKATATATATEALAMLQDIPAPSAFPQIGDRVTVTEGAHAGRTGTVTEVGTTGWRITRVDLDGGENGFSRSDLIAAARLAPLIEPQSMTLTVVGDMGVHWGNDGHTACGVNNAAAAGPMSGEPTCRTCRTVWTVTAN